jgi:hypothetical protein
MQPQPQPLQQLQRLLQLVSQLRQRLMLQVILQ